MTTITEAVDDYSLKKITLEQLTAVIKESHPSAWVTLAERDPQHPEGDNNSRNRFIYNPYHHPKGQFFQNVIKKAIMKAIDFAHGAMLKKYDKDVFVYGDPRLKKLDEFVKQYTQENFKDTPYKIDFMNKITDIALGLAKEDIYYRARMFDMMNRFAFMYPIYKLTELELENVNRIRMTSYYCEKCKMQHDGYPTKMMHIDDKFMYTC